MGFEKSGFGVTWNLMVLRCFEKIKRKVLGQYKVFTKAVLFIPGLVICHAFVEYAVVGVFITYLTQKWDRTLPKAAELVNFQDGLSTVLKIVLAFLSDAYFGRFKMVMYSTAVYIVGLATLTIAAWKNIRQTELLWVALVLVSIGRAGRSAPLKAFLADQLRSYELTPEESEKKKESHQNFWWNASWFLGSLIALVLAASTSTDSTPTGSTPTDSTPTGSTPTKIPCLISAIAIFAAWLIFFSGFSFYNYTRLTGSSLSTVLLVFKVAMAKRRLSYPLSPSQFYKNDGDEVVLLPSLRFFRWLDKAAILEPASICPEEQQEKEGKLCTVAEVKEVKHLLTMVPMWTTLLVYSLVDATGSTFFFEQADLMDRQLGIIKVPTEIFLMIRAFIGFIVSYFYRRNNQHVPMMIGIGMMWSILSCCTAAIVAVELRREAVNSAFAVIPQFIFLGLMEGFAINGLSEFYDAHASESVRIYGPEFTDCVLGIGKFIGIILIVVCKDWFGDDVRSSHLGRYYGLIAFLNVLNLIAFGYIASQYGNNALEMKDCELEEVVVVDRSYLPYTHWRNRYRFWSKCSPDESETVSHRSKKSPHRLITLTGCGTELCHHIVNNENEQNHQLRTRYPERLFHHAEKLFPRSFTAIGFETNRSAKEMPRRKYIFAPKSSLEASILMSKGWGPGANYSLPSCTSSRNEPGKEE